MERCFGSKEGQELYATYHDEEWGIPVYDDQTLFEFLILEGAQAGLSWYTILSRREGYREAFKGFDPAKVAAMTDDELEALRENSKIIRNKLKIYSARSNAKVFLEIQNDYGSFKDFLWAYVDQKPIVNQRKSPGDMPVTTKISDQLSIELKRRGMKFVGTTIMYAYMQAVGMVDDHLDSCWKRNNN